MLVAQARVRLQALADDALQAPRHVRPLAPGRHRGSGALQRHQLDEHRQGGVAALVRERALAGEDLVEHHAQRVDVGAVIDLLLDLRVLGDQRPQVLGGHVGDGAADDGLGLGLGVAGAAGQVEVQQHRLAVEAHQDVRRLDVVVQHAALVRVLQPVGQAGHDPRRRPVVVQAAQQVERGRARAAHGRLRGDFLHLARAGLARALLCRRLDRSLDGLQGPHQLLALRRPGVGRPQVLQDVGQAGAAEVRHAHGPQAGLAVLVDGVDGDDVGVLQLRQRLRFRSLRGGALDDDPPTGQVALLGQEDAGEGAAPQLLAEAEVEDLVARLGQRRDGGAVAEQGMSHGARP